MEPQTLLARLLTARAVALKVLALFIIASVGWWAWRFVSLEFTAVFADAFRKAGLPEEYGIRT